MFLMNPKCDMQHLRDLNCLQIGVR